MSNQSRTDFEELILGSILFDDKCIDDVVEAISVDDFTLEKHKIIFDVMLMLLSEGTPIDCFIMEKRLASLKKIDLAGGLAELLRLRNIGFTPSSAPHYAKTLARETVKRKLMLALQNAIEAVAGDQDDFLELAQKEIFSVSFKGRKEPINARDAMPLVYSRLIELYENKRPLAGLSTGFIELDKKTGGFMPGELIILGARPGMGKTAFALNIAGHAALEQQKTVAFFSLEMSNEVLLHRLLSSGAEISGSKFRNGNFDECDIEKINQMQEKIFHQNLILSDLRGLNAIDIRSRCRSIKRKHGLDLIVIDYLGLIKCDKMRGKVENMNQQLGQITKQLRDLAQEVDCPVLLLSQLNRNLESRNDKRPMTADLRDSGEIEQDADLILFVYRDEVYNQDTQDKNIAEINIAKQRSGGTGVFKLGFEGRYYRFTNHYQERAYIEEPVKKDFSQKYSYTKTKFKD